jgi:hypothetical protein
MLEKNYLGGESKRVYNKGTLLISKLGTVTASKSQTVQKSEIFLR